MNDYKKIKWNDYHNLSSKKGKYKIIRYYSNRNICYEHYRINGKGHRENGPAIIQYYENGNINVEQYFINDNWHREDGPAVIDYFKNGNIEYEYYFINGKRHKENGPSIIEYHKNGNIKGEGYYLCDKFFSKEEYCSQKIQAILNIAKMMNTWESKYNFIGLSLENHS